MTGPDPVVPVVPVPDVVVLRRRLLLVAVLSLALLLTASYVVTALGVGDVWLLLAAVALYALVVRPLVRPVRDAVRLRRRLAYQAFLEQRATVEGEQR